MRASSAGVAHDRIVMAHGGGGELMRQLIHAHLLEALWNDVLAPLDDGAVLNLPGPQVFTTDSYVVTPIEFPGGDIGRLAVAGTANDLAVMGATPRALSLALVLEEGLPIATLDRIVGSIARTAREAGVEIATGDTKVIERRSADEPSGMIINTAGIGTLRAGVRLDAQRVTPGDAILVNGNIAEHGLAVMSVRHGLAFESTLRSDVAPLHAMIDGVLDDGCDVKFMRDATRGGIAGVLADLCEARELSIEVDEAKIPLSRTARHAAEMLGLDPLTVANEGKVVMVVGAADAQRALARCRAHPLGRQAAIIGVVTERTPALVELLTRAGGRRVVQRPYGEDLPRIC